MEKKVGDFEYMFVSEGAPGRVPSSCINSCIYKRIDTGKMYCFAPGDLHVECEDDAVTGPPDGMTYGLECCPSGSLTQYYGNIDGNWREDWIEDGTFIWSDEENGFLYERSETHYELFKRDEDGFWNYYFKRESGEDWKKRTTNTAPGCFTDEQVFHVGFPYKFSCNL